MSDADHPPPGTQADAMKSRLETWRTSQEEAGAPAGAEEAKPKTTRGGGRRAALKIIRQNVESVSKDLTSFRKTHEASSKKLEKQVASLRNDLNALKSYISKESAKARSKQEASFSRILSKLNAPKPTKVSGKKEHKGKAKGRSR